MMNQGSSSSFANKRKRGRPRRDEGQTQLNPPVCENLIGQVVSGVVEGSFEAGYFLNVKVADTEKQLKGIVFLPDKVAPVTPTTDLFPQAKMYSRQDILIPSSNQQNPPEVMKKNAANQTDDFGSEPQTDNLFADKNLSAIDESTQPMDIEMKDVGGTSADEKLTEPVDQTLSLMPQFASDDHTFLRSEACEPSKTVTTSSPKDSFAKGSTTFLDFFPAPATNRKQATGSSSSLSLELFQDETKQSGTDDEKSPADAGMEVKPASPVDDVPAELQLELGNKKMNADQPASSKSGFLVNLFESREETVKEPEEIIATGSESGFPEEATQVDDNDS